MKKLPCLLMAAVMLCSLTAGWAENQSPEDILSSMTLREKAA